MTKLYRLEDDDDVQVLHESDAVSREDSISPDSVHVPVMLVERRDGRKRLREPVLFPVWAASYCLAFRADSEKSGELEALFADAGMPTVDCVTTDHEKFRVGFVAQDIDPEPGTQYDERFTPPDWAPDAKALKWAVVSNASTQGALAFRNQGYPRTYVYFTEEFVGRLEALGVLDGWTAIEAGEVV